MPGSVTTDQRYSSRLWSGWASFEPAACGVERRLPDANVVLLINLASDRLSFYDGRAFDKCHVVPGIAVATPRLHPVGLDKADQHRLLGVELSPGAARTFLGVAPGSLDAPLLALEELWGSAARELHEQMAESDTLAVAWQLFHEALNRRAGPPPEPGLVQALAQLRAGVKVSDVAARTGFSASTFTRRVHSEAGLLPKQLHRLARLDRVLSADADQEDGWALIAASAGYADQSHLGREFLALTGLTPQQYRDSAPTAARHVPIER